jgi:hypothetical protein
VGEEVSGPSLETEAEALERRKVEALEAIADHLATIASAVEPARKAWNDPEGWNHQSATKAYIRTDVDR